MGKGKARVLLLLRLSFHEKFFRSATSNRLPQGQSYPRENIFFSLEDSSKNDNKKILANMSYNVILDVIESGKK